MCNWVSLSLSLSRARALSLTIHLRSITRDLKKTSSFAAATYTCSNKGKSISRIVVLPNDLAALSRTSESTERVLKFLGLLQLHFSTSRRFMPEPTVFPERGGGIFLEKWRETCGTREGKRRKIT